MTPVDELVLAKLNTGNFEFTDKELKFLINIVKTHIDFIYSGNSTYSKFSERYFE